MIGLQFCLELLDGAEIDFIEELYVISKTTSSMNVVLTSKFDLIAFSERRGMLLMKSTLKAGHII
jgi:hypothetical protein